MPLTFDDLSLLVDLTSLDDVAGAGVQLEAVLLVGFLCHHAHLDVLQRDDTFGLLVLKTSTNLIKTLLNRLTE